MSRMNVSIMLPLNLSLIGLGPLAFGLWSLVFGLWSLVFGLWSLVFGLWSLVFGLWSLVFGLWSLVFGFTPLLPKTKGQRPKSKVRHSYFSASSGSTFAALRAGKYEAATAVNANTAAVETNVAGSVGATPKTNFDRKPVNAREPASPNVTPITARSNACLITICST